MLFWPYGKCPLGALLGVIFIFHMKTRAVIASESDDYTNVYNIG